MVDMEYALQPQFFPGRPHQEFKVKNFFKWFRDFFYVMTYDHHENEEEIFIPWIRSRAVIPAKVQDDHTTILNALKDILAMEGKFNVASHSPRAMEDRYMLADELRFMVRDFCEMMRHHLREEEEIIPVIMRDHFTREEEQKVVERIIARMQTSFRGEAIAWIARVARQWMLAHEYEGFEASLPGPVRFMLRKLWAKQHVENNVQLLRSVTYDAEPPAKPVCECACTVS
eukprot:tig00020944_g16387.t1